MGRDGALIESISFDQIVMGSKFESLSRHHVYRDPAWVCDSLAVASIALRRVNSDTVSIAVVRSASEYVWT